METKELMIGDWVYCKEKKKYGRVDKLEHDVEDESVEPIPLTEEILKKNGFLGNDYGEIIIGEWRIMCDCLYVAILHNEHVCIDTPIRYVHELQHALRLCKIDKEIEL